MHLFLLKSIVVCGVGGADSRGVDVPSGARVPLLRGKITNRARHSVMVSDIYGLLILYWIVFKAIFELPC